MPTGPSPSQGSRYAQPQNIRCLPPSLTETGGRAGPAVTPPWGPGSRAGSWLFPGSPALGTPAPMPEPGEPPLPPTKILWPLGDEVRQKAGRLCE